MDTANAGYVGDSMDDGVILTEAEITAIEAVWESDPSAIHEKQWTEAMEKSLTVATK